MRTTIHRLYELGQSVWCDSISRGMIDKGDLQTLLQLGIVGVTSNPTIFMNAITGGTDYDALLEQLAAEGKSTLEIYEGLVIPDIQDAADILRPVYDRTDGEDGYVSLEVSPRLAYDLPATLEEARRLFTQVGRPNVFIKVPATADCIVAIETLIAEGINVNVTLIFSQRVHELVMHAYLNGLRKRIDAGKDVRRVASVASFFVSRVDTLVDRLLTERVLDQSRVAMLRGRAAIANAKLAYARFERMFDPSGPFGILKASGARVQRPLWASTSTKDPSYPDTKYVDDLVGPNSVNTMPPQTIDATLARGTTEVRIHEDLSDARRHMDELAEVGIDMRQVTDELLRDGVNLFRRSYDQLLTALEARTARHAVGR